MKYLTYLVGVGILIAHTTTNTYLTKTSDDNEKGFILITTLYNEQHPERAQEYLTCLKNNLSHELIDEVHILYDTSKNNGVENTILNFIKESNAFIHFIDGRASFGQCFDLANQFTNKKVIVCNADIYFNHTLSLLKTYDFTNTFIALTRWDINNDKKISLHPKEDSQDVWIFQAPIRAFEKTSIHLGINSCDSAIAYQAQKSGMHVLNPCFSIQSIHLHQSNIRNYDSFCPYSIREKIKVCHSFLPMNRLAN